MGAKHSVSKLRSSFASIAGRLRNVPQAETFDRRTTCVTDTAANVVNGVSVDLEDYYHVEAFASRISRSEWATFPSRVRQNTSRTLQLLDQEGCRATFFVLGWIAEREPSLIRELADAGHEVACHSHLHRPLHTLKPSEFRDDLRRSRDAIEGAAGVRVLGFRAPTFSITNRTVWALDILLEEGFRYDSSIFPIHHDLYGIPDAPRWAHRRQTLSKTSIWEIPPSTMRILKMNIPFGGGGYLRLLPMSFTRWAIARTQNLERQPVIVYFHPWELDPEQPRLSGSWRSRLRHYTGLTKTADRLREILSAGTFEPLINLVHRLDAGFQAVPAIARESLELLPAAAPASLNLGQSA